MSESEVMRIQVGNDPELIELSSEMAEDLNFLLPRLSPKNVDATEVRLMPPLKRTKKNGTDENIMQSSASNYAQSTLAPRLMRPAHSLFDDYTVLREPVADSEELKDVFKSEESYMECDFSNSSSTPEPISSGVLLFSVLRNDPHFLDGEIEGFEEFILDNFYELRVAADKTGNGLDILRSLTFYNCASAASQRIADSLKEALRRPYSDLARHQPLTKEKLPAAKAEELKDILWASCSAFYVLKYYPNHKFDYSQTAEEELFIRSECKDILQDKDEDNKRRLIIYCWTMKRSYALFGGGRKKDFLIEFVTRMTEGRLAALSSNTTGGGLLGDTRGNNKCAIERCRREIYVRISGTPPVGRSHTRHK
jgi:hypothetical protein